MAVANKPAAGRRRRGTKKAPAAPAWQAYRPLALCPDAVRIGNLLHRSLPAPLDLPGATGRLSRVTRDVATDSWLVDVGLAAAGLSVTVTLSRELLALVLAKEVEPDRFMQLPPTLGGGLLAAALDPLLDGIEQRLGYTCALTRTEPARDPPDANDYHFKFATDAGTARLALRAGDGAQRLIEALAVARRPAARELPDVPVPITVRLPPLGLTAEELASLRCGDILLPGLPSDPETLPIAVGHEFDGTARRTADGYRLETPLMNRKANASTPDEAPSLLETGDLTLDVSFDIGRTTIALQDLPALQPGYVIAIPDALPDRVAVRINGKAVARGELVTVGEQLGVRLLERLDGAGPGES